MQLEPTDLWDTIDDEVLSKIIYDTSVENTNKQVDKQENVNVAVEA